MSDLLWDNQKEQKLLQCLYCGNKTLMDMVGEHIQHWGTEDYHGYDKHRMFFCPACKKITFCLTYWEDGMQDWKGNDFEANKILYPINSIDEKAMPQKIKDTFEAALKTRNINNDICLMALRKTIEMICVDKGATEWGLKKKIEELAQKGVLPEPLKEASSFTKTLGDSATHDKGLNINSHDINEMIDFVKYIIEYLYILPYKLEKYKKRLNLLEEN